jgi:WD40 repeat protein
MNRPTIRRWYAPALLLSLAAAAAAARQLYPVSAAPLPRPPGGVRLTDPVEVTVKDLCIHNAAVLADNHSVAVVGTTDLREDADPEAAAPGGAIVDLKTRAVRPFTNGHRARLSSAACTGDGSGLVTGSTSQDKSLRVWDVRAGKSLDPIDLSAFDINLDFTVVCSARGRQVAADLGDRVAVFDLARPGERIDLTAKSFSGNNGPGHPAISPNGRLVACTTTQREVVVWDVATRKIVYTSSLLPEGVNKDNCHLWQLCFTKAGRGLIVRRSLSGHEVPKGTAENEVPADRRALHLIDLDQRRVTPLGMGHQIDTLSFALHPNEEWIATVGRSHPPRAGKGSADELRVYHYPTRSLALRVQFDDFHPNWVGFTRDGKKLVAVSSFHGKIKCWDFTPAQGPP